MEQAQVRVPQQLFVLAGCLRRLGVTELQEITQRIDAQKRIYLLQVAGLDLRYQFTWDLFGPFSRGLANDIAAYRSQAQLLVPLLEKLQFTESAEEGFRRADKLIKRPERLKDEVTQLQWIELVASLHFIAMNRSPRKTIRELSREEQVRVFEELAERKIHLIGLTTSANVAFELLASEEDNGK